MNIMSNRRFTVLFLLGLLTVWKADTSYDHKPYLIGCVNGWCFTASRMHEFVTQWMCFEWLLERTSLFSDLHSHGRWKHILVCVCVCGQVMICFLCVTFPVSCCHLVLKSSAANALEGYIVLRYGFIRFLSLH